jgi:hypothetical protein
MIGSTPEYYALSSLHLGLAVGQPPVYVMRWAASLSNMFTHSLYVLESLPKSDSDFRGIVARPPAFGGAASARIEELKRKHGANWEDWYIGDHVLVSVYGSTPPTFFATETFHDKSNPSRAIVFVLDSSGMSLELCALRRVCGCDTVCYQALNTDREKRSLRPSRKYCDRIKD